MNRIFITLLIILVLTSCSQDSKPKPFEFKDYNFESLQAQADSLLLFMTNAILTDTMNHDYWNQKFFCAFPNSFKEMEAILGLKKHP